MSECDPPAAKKSRLEVLPPPFVVDYLPYSNHQLDLTRSSTSTQCAKHWDNYYKNNTTNGYKDRHYILREHVELLAALESLKKSLDGNESSDASDKIRQKVSLVEIGCGVGNAIMPIVEEYASLRDSFQIYCFDISQTAVQILRQKVTTLGIEGRVHCMHLDLAKHPLVPTNTFLSSPANFATMIFVLSSVPVADHDAFVSRIPPLLTVGGVLMVRDYCHLDHAEKRFSARKKLVGEDNSFARSNGTLSHFFTLSEFVELFARHGLAAIDVKIVERQVENRLLKTVMERRWIQGRFRRE